MRRASSGAGQSTPVDPSTEGRIEVRPMKTFGLAMVIAMAAMPFAGASEALAEHTALCSSEEEGKLTCAAGNRIAGFHAVALDPEFLTTIGTVLCTSSLMQATVLGLGSPQIGHLSELTWAGCLLKEKLACTVTSVLLGELLILKTHPNLGELEYHGTEFRINCGAFFNCIYGRLFTQHIEGDQPPPGGGTGISANELKLESVEELGCPEVAWDTSYQFLTPTYIKS